MAVSLILVLQTRKARRGGVQGCTVNLVFYPPRKRIDNDKCKESNYCSYFEQRGLMQNSCISILRSSIGSH